ncbi:hypothetical protein M1O20_06040 [Dehalococcoidia bacterium]|nr:hypothetical protein [Dehalococcoidia bacterium]MCL0060020.1 hypothetical protein [Dehalococcoidia bacterium]MCL0103560.1 hypothetical protein [Dehalococcoidia bacterium]
MNKWIAIPVIAVLAVAVVVVGLFLWQQTSKLGEAESEIVALEGNITTLEGNISTLETELAESKATVSTLEADLRTANSEIVALEGDVATLEGNISTLETELAESEARVSILEADLVTANAKIEDLQADLSTQRNINLALSEELKTVTYPRHFESLAELVDWLQEDDTDTRYAGEPLLQQAFILQVRALRDGYLLPVSLYVEDELLWVSNSAVIGDSMYIVSPTDDSVVWYTHIFPIPSRPIAR